MVVHRTSSVSARDEVVEGAKSSPVAGADPRPQACHGYIGQPRLLEKAKS